MLLDDKCGKWTKKSIHEIHNFHKNDNYLINTKTDPGKIEARQ